MSVSVLLITHGEIGHALLNAATKTLGELPLLTRAVAIQQNCQPEKLIEELRIAANEVDCGDGVLILTDLFGATPCNIASKLQTDDHIQIVTGLNLPMLIRVMNYPDLDLLQLAQKAYSGGRDGICCTQVSLAA